MADTTTESSLKTTQLPALKLPCNGEFLAAHRKKYQELVVLVPFYKAHKSQLRLHADLLRENGYDIVLFDLDWSLGQLQKSYVSSQQLLGMKHIWADQIENILNSFAGPKIIFAFSNPAASAIEAIARRHAADIKGLVLDSGPAGNFIGSLVNYYTTEEPLKLPPLRWAAAFVVSLAWSPQFKTALHHDLQSLPENFPILSIRGWKDQLISADNMDSVFAPHEQLDWRKLSLPQAGHLNGLRDFAVEYVPPVLEFLQLRSTPL